jgi:hypothetical protein
MDTLRMHIVMPKDLASKIDELVGERGRSAFLVDLARSEVRRRNLLAFLNDPVPIWKDEDHPELARLGTAAYVRKMRSTKSERQKRIERKLAERP